MIGRLEKGYYRRYGQQPTRRQASRPAAHATGRGGPGNRFARIGAFWIKAARNRTRGLGSGTALDSLGGSVEPLGIERREANLGGRKGKVENSVHG